MDLEDALRHALDGDAFLFLGAGFSRGTKNIVGTEPKLGTELTTYLGNQAGAAPGATLEDASEAFLSKYGSNYLVGELTKQFRIKEVQTFHETIANVAWIRVYTTNYDDAFEFSAHQKGKPVQPLTLEADAFALDRTKLACIHLNGSVDSLSVDTLNTTFKLTETSYATASIASSPWAVRLREDCRLAKAVFFMGYSLYDLDIRRILVESPALKSKSFFIVGKAADELTLQRVGRYGTPIARDVEQVANELSRLSYSYKPIARRIFDFNSLDEITSNLTQPEPTDSDILDLFELGQVHDGCIEASLSRNLRYYLTRSKANEVLDLLNNDTKVVAISASLGNGKTLLLKGIAVKAIEAGYRVFEAKEQTENAAIEFESIAKLDQRVLLLVDNYQNWMREIRAFRQVNNNQTRLIVTARDTVHDVYYEKLERECGVSSVPEILIDKLDAKEREWFVSTLDQYGLWRSLAGKSYREKLSIVESRFHSEIHGIVLGLLESNDIGDRVRSVIASLSGNRDYFDVVTSVFIFNAVNLRPTIDMLHDLWGTALLSSTTFRNHASIRQLIDFDRWQIQVKSPIIAEYVLRNANAAEIVSVMTKLSRHVATLVKVTPRYRSISNELVRFATLQRVLPENGRREATIRYYESIKDLSNNQRDPLFWLQYAIGCLVGEDLKRAKLYFDTAYSLAERNGFDTFQIDNHYARYLLFLTVSTETSVSTAISTFREARSIINRQLQHERLHYPFRVACLYQDLIDKFGTHLSPDICREIITAAEFILERAHELSDYRANHPQVRRCVAAMNYVVQRCKELSGE